MIWLYCILVYYSLNESSCYGHIFLVDSFSNSLNLSVGILLRLAWAVLDNICIFERRVHRHQVHGTLLWWREWWISWRWWWWQYSSWPYASLWFAKAASNHDREHSIFRNRFAWNITWAIACQSWHDAGWEGRWLSITSFTCNRVVWSEPTGIDESSS